MIHKLWLNFQEFGYIILDVLSTDYLGKIIHDIIGLVQGWHLQFLRTPFDVLKIRSHGPVRGRPNLIRVRGPHSIPFLSSFFDSSKFFLNLFAACFIFTKVLPLVLTHASCPSFTPGTSLARVQSEFGATWSHVGKIIWYVDFRFSTGNTRYVRQISRIHLGHVTWFISKLKSEPDSKRVQLLTQSCIRD